jgi:hypothetical protein
MSAIAGEHIGKAHQRDDKSAAQMAGVRDARRARRARRGGTVMSGGGPDGSLKAPTTPIPGAMLPRYHGTLPVSSRRSSLGTTNMCARGSR